MTDLKVGDFYNVPCAEIVMDDRRNYFIPIFDHLHTDSQFGFPHEHYHIDGRFHLHPRMQHEFGLSSGHTSSVIVPDSEKPYKFVALTVQNLKCERLKTGLVIPENPTEKQKPKLELYENWYQDFIGKICEGRKCPHLGTEMLEKDGRLICPMHNLTADIQSLKIIRLK